MFNVKVSLLFFLLIVLGVVGVSFTVGHGRKEAVRLAEASFESLPAQYDALRELREETGLVPARCYNLSRVESFYRHATDEVGFIPVFAVFVGGAPVRLSAEHDAFEWLPVPAAQGRLAWPRERRGLEDIQVLLSRGTAGPLDDVLAVALPGPAGG